MKAFTTLSGVAAVLYEANVDTNQICPTRFNQVPRSSRFASILFHDRRFAANGGARPDFVLNRPPCDRAVILVSGANFGCGSSRETAVYALLEFGIRAVIAESFGDIFKANAYRSGLLPIELGATAVRALVEKLAGRPGATVEVDLPSQAVMLEGEPTLHFDIHPLIKERMIKGIDEIALTNQLADRIDAFEKRYLCETFWLMLEPAVNDTGRER